MFKKVTVCILAAVMSVGLWACDNKGSKDNRPSIFFSVFDGGYGAAWAEMFANKFNEQHPENVYKISVRPSKDEYNTLKSRLEAGTEPGDILMTDSKAHQLFEPGLLEDITDVWNSTPDGDGKTVEQMMDDSPLYKSAYSDKAGKLYAVPLTVSFFGFVYDHDVFLQNKLLFNEAGSFITSETDALSIGRDGTAGTYDDGHPQTEAQWEAMYNKAQRAMGYSLVYTGKFQNYLNSLYEALYAQYEGVNQYMFSYSLDGTYDFGNGVEQIGLDNGFKVFEMPGRLKSLQFMDRYVATKDGMTKSSIFPSTSSLSFSHADAQYAYINSAVKNESGKKIAMIYEGDWWEREAKNTFDAFSKKKPEYQFGTRNYRFMTLPLLDGAQQTEGHVFNASNSLYLAVKKQTDAQKRDIILEFLTYIHSTESLRAFTKTTGGIRPYSYELQESDLEGLSPFTKNAISIYRDDKNTILMQYAQIGANIPSRSDAYTQTSNGKDWVVTNGLYYYDAQEYFNRAVKHHKDNWTSGLNIKGSIESYKTALGKS